MKARNLRAFLLFVDMAQMHAPGARRCSRRTT
jgi:hypothetical protein